MAYDWWLAPSVIAGLQIAQLEAGLTKAASKEGKLVFRFPLTFRLGIIGAAGALSYLEFRDWTTTEWWIELLGAALVVCFLLGWPPTIATSERGIERYWWWKRKIFVPWIDVEDAVVNPSGDITVIASNASISFSRFQNDPFRFRQEIISHSKIKKITNEKDIMGLSL